MIPVMVLVQQGQMHEGVRQELEHEIEMFAQRHFIDRAAIDWMEVPEGSGFTAGESSTSVVVSLQSNRILDQSVRVPLLEELSDLCMRHTHRTPHEMVVAVRDLAPIGEV